MKSTKQNRWNEKAYQAAVRADRRAKPINTKDWNESAYLAAVARDAIASRAVLRS